MNFKPSDFFIGLVEFFSVLLPGFCIICILTDEKIIPFPKTTYVDLWIYYAISSYISGHILYAFSGLWKKTLNDWLVIQFYSKEGCLRKNFKSMAEARGIALIKKAEEIKRVCFKSITCNQNIKVYDWIKVLMSESNPEATSNLKRLEADSNFFRSFTIVCVVAGCVYCHKTPILISSILVFLFSIWRFVNRRFNAEEFAALYLINKYNEKLQKTIKEKASSKTEDAVSN